MIPDTATLWLFAGASLLLLITPGPAVLYIVARSMEQGRVAGLVAVLGVHVGTLAHVGAAALGLSAIVVSSAAAFNMVRLLGVGYLLYLGVRTLLNTVPPSPDPAMRRRAHRRIFLESVLVNVTNPKLALFFFAFLPQFVDVGRGSVPAQITLLGAVFIVIGILSDAAYALAAGTLGRLVTRHPSRRNAGRYVSGGIYIGLGLLAAFTGRRQ